MAGKGVGDELFGQFAGLGRGDGPSGHVAREDVDDHVELVGDPPLGASQFRYVPGPHLIGFGGDKFGFLARRMGALAAAFTVFPGTGQQPVHGGN